MVFFTRWGGLLALLLSLGAPARAQFTTAVPDGIINAAEYNNNQFGANDQGTGGGTWYISWNNTTLYLAKSGATGNQPCYVYLDVDPVQPVTDFSGANGGNARGNIVGYSNSASQVNGDFSIIPRLPFRADARLYFQDDYVGVSVRQGDGTWGPTVSAGTVGARAGSREAAVPWNALTANAGRPASFNFLAYQTNRNAGTGNYRYDLAPTNAPAFALGGGTQPAFEYYFTVPGTDDQTYPTAGGNTPFSLVSFTARQGVDYATFNDSRVWDFTLDYPTSSIERAGSTTGTDWRIGGTLVVGNGTLTFGPAGASGSTTVGNLLVTGAGVLNMNATTNPLSVTAGTAGAGNVLLSNGGTLTLSSAAGGDLLVPGNLTVQGSSTRFQPNGRTVALVGLAQTLTGPATPSLRFSNLTIAGSEPASVVQLKSDITVRGSLTFTQGQLRTVDAGTVPATPHTVRLGNSGQLVGERAASALTGYASSRRAVGAGNSGSVDFGSLGLVLTPAGTSAALDSVTVTRSRGLAALAGTEAASIQRNFRLQPTGTGGSYDVGMTLTYFDDELNGSAKRNLALYASPDALTTGLTPGGTFAKLALSSLDPSRNQATRTDLSDLGQGSPAGGMVFTLGDQATPLPVQLVSFAATRTSPRTVRLAWRTALELQNAGFGIERQVAGGAWQALAFVLGQGTGPGRPYDYLDATAPTGPAYYRLRQTDLNGAATYSPVVAVPGTGVLPAAAISLSPVPVPAGQPTLAIDLSLLPPTARTLAVYDLQGRLVGQAIAPAEAATAILPVAALAAGTYVVLVQDSAASYRARFVKL